VAVDTLIELDLPSRTDALFGSAAAPRTADSRVGLDLPPEVVALVEAVDALADRVERIEGWAATEGVVVVEQQIARLTGVVAGLLVRVDADGLWATGTQRSLAAWVATRTGSSFQHGRRRVELARALRDHLPLTSRALTGGEVSVDQAMTLASTPTTSARQVALSGSIEECGEAFLLGQAKVLSTAELRNLTRNWAAAVDPDADERGYRAASEAEFVALSPTTGGFHLAGFLTTDHGAVLREALTAVTSVPAPGDTRTTQQRRAGALTDLARIALDHGLVATGALQRPHLNVVVDYDTLARTLDGTGLGTVRGGGETLVGGRAGGNGARDMGASHAGRAPFHLRPVMEIERFAIAEIIGAGPIPPSVLARLACDSSVSRIVFGPQSQVLDAGRAERIFAGPRRRTIIARDKHCTFPGCTAPPAISETHHLDQWAFGGGSHADRGTLLCYFHHEYVHAHRVAIERTATGGLRFTRNGQPLRM